MKKFSIIMIIVSIVLLSNVYAEDYYRTCTPVLDINSYFYMTEEREHCDGNLYIDGNYIESDSGVKIEMTFDENLGEHFIPLRTVMEGIGARVTWREETQDILIEYQGRTYCAYARYYDYVEDKSGKKMEDYALFLEGDNGLVQLSPMSKYGGYLEVNDRIYLFEFTATYLLREFGYEYSISDDGTTVYIYKAE